MSILTDIQNVITEGRKQNLDFTHIIIPVDQTEQFTAEISATKLIKNNPDSNETENKEFSFCGLGVLVSSGDKIQLAKVF